MNAHYRDWRDRQLAERARTHGEPRRIDQALAQRLLRIVDRWDRKRTERQRRSA